MTDALDSDRVYVHSGPPAAPLPAMVLQQQQQQQQQHSLPLPSTLDVDAASRPFQHYQTAPHVAEPIVPAITGYVQRLPPVTGFDTGGVLVRDDTTSEPVVVTSPSPASRSTSFASSAAYSAGAGATTRGAGGGNVMIYQGDPDPYPPLQQQEPPEQASGARHRAAAAAASAAADELHQAALGLTNDLDLDDAQVECLSAAAVLLTKPRAGGGGGGDGDNKLTKAERKRRIVQIRSCLKWSCAVLIVILVTWFTKGFTFHSTRVIARSVAATSRVLADGYYAYTDRMLMHEQRHIHVASRIEENLRLNPAEDCTSAIETGDNSFHIAIRHDHARGGGGGSGGVQKSHLHYLHLLNIQSVKPVSPERMRTRAAAAAAKRTGAAETDERAAAATTAADRDHDDASLEPQASWMALVSEQNPLCSPPEEHMNNRYLYVQVEYLDMAAEHVTEIFSGGDARCIQAYWDVYRGEWPCRQ